MKYKKYLAGAVAAGLLISPLTVFGAAQSETVRIQEIKADNAQELALPADTYVIDSKIADVTGDNIEDTIYLVGHKQSQKAIYANQLSIVLKNGKSKAIRMQNIEKLGGYNAKLFIGDFTGNHINDIMISAPTGGSGGIVEHAIASFNGDLFDVVFGSKENLGVKFTGRFIDGFQAELTAESIGKKTIIDNSANKESYIRLGIYNVDGKLLKEQKPYSYPLSVLEPVDIDRDGVYELKGHQRIVGAYNADTLAEAESVLKYQNGQWMIKEMKVSSYLLKNSERPLVASYNLVRHSIKTDSAEIYYPQVENMKGILTMGYINQDLEKAAKKYLAEARPDAKVFIDYEVTRQDNNVLSVVFKGRQQWENGEYKILASVNEDINSRNQMFVKNLIKSDAKSRKAITALLREAASKNPNIKHFPELGDWMGMYLTDSDLVFYYLENDNATDYVEIAVPLKSVKQYFNEKIQSIDGVETAS